MSAALLNGFVLQSIGGFYTVEAADAVYSCRARGIFRKNEMSPMAGDHVRISVQREGEGAIEEILPRTSALIRPPLANLEILLIVVSVKEPSPNLTVVDKMTAVAIHHGIKPVIVISKSDLADTAQLEQIYTAAGLRVFCVGEGDDAALPALRAYLCGKLSAVAGNSGVGKSSLLNRIFPDLFLETAEISRKLGRGRHTTRTTTLHKLSEGGYLADTPGFSSLDTERALYIPKDDLVYCFPEFEQYLFTCRFSPSCTHTAEPGCAIRNAVEAGRIMPSRYESYVNMYNAVKNRREWEDK